MSDPENKGVKKYRLCLVIPSLQAGGMERAMSELATYFSSKETLELHLILYGITREVFYSVPGSVTVHKPSFRFNNGLRLFSTLRTLAYLRSVVKKISPDAVLSFGEYWNSFVLIALAGLKYPVYISDRCQPDKSFGFFHDMLRRRLYTRSAGVIAQTVKAGEIYHAQALNTNIRVIGNPIRNIPPDRNTGRENIILTVGRLIDTKHHDRLTELFLSIPDPRWKLVIVGYDHLKQNISVRLQKIIAENNAEARVSLEGKRADVDAYYLKSKVFAFTSSSEGFPNVIGEAMSAGLPVVAFDCIAGPSEMINHCKSGFLVPLFDYELFRERLITLMEDSDLRENFGRQARKDILKYSIENIGEQYIDFMKLST